MKNASVAPQASQTVGDQPQTEVTPPHLPKSSSKPPLLWFGIGLLILVLGGWYYFLSNKTQPVVQSPTPTPIISVFTTPTTDPTAIWKSYTNNKYGYSFRYRPDLEGTDRLRINNELIEIYGLHNLVIAIKPIKERVEDLTNWWLTLETEPYTKIAISRFAFKETDSIDFWSTKDLLKMPSEVLKVELKSGFQEPNQTFRTFFIQRNTHIIEIVADYGDEADQILSTFRFVDKDEIKSGWKMYSDEENGYRIQYPTDWYLRDTTAHDDQAGRYIQLYNYDISTAAGRDFDPEKDKGKLKIELLTHTKETDKTLAEFVESQKQQRTQEPSDQREWSEASIIVDSQPAVIVTQGFYQNKIFIKKVIVKHPQRGYFYSILFELDFYNHPDLINQILNTFRFNS